MGVGMEPSPELLWFTRTRGTFTANLLCGSRAQWTMSKCYHGQHVQTRSCLTNIAVQVQIKPDVSPDPSLLRPAFCQVVVQSKANLPHLRRALTDVQELKQVGEIWGKNLYYHQNLVVGVTYFIRRCPKKCYPLPSLSFGWYPWEVAGGTDFVEQTLASLKPQTVSTTLMLDLHCYDGWPALAVLQDTCFSF